MSSKFYRFKNRVLLEPLNWKRVIETIFQSTNEPERGVRSCYRMVKILKFITEIQINRWWVSCGRR
jgi:hypothetical protein